MLGSLGTVQMSPRAWGAAVLNSLVDSVRAIAASEPKTVA